MTEKEKEMKVIADATAMILAYDVHEAAQVMAERLNLNAEVKTVVDKWDERGQITGWTKVSKARGPVKVLIEVFVSDIAGENGEFDRYRRNMEELIAENAALRARPEPPLHGYAEGVKAAADIAGDAWHTYREPTDWDYGARDACTKIHNAIRALTPPRSLSRD